MQRNESDIIWASGQFLTEPLPDDYDQWSNGDFDEFILTHLWEPFEDYDASFIWEQIEHLALSVRNYIEDSNAKK